MLPVHPIRLQLYQMRIRNIASAIRQIPVKLLKCFKHASVYQISK